MFDSAAFLVAFLEFLPSIRTLSMSSPARRRLGRQRGSSNAQLDPQSPERTLFPGSFSAFLVELDKGDPCETGLGGVFATFSDENSSQIDDRLQIAESAHQEPEGLAEHAA